MRTPYIASPSIAHARAKPWLRLLTPALLAVLVLTGASALRAQEATRAPTDIEAVSTPAEFGKLFDSVVETIQKSFFDAERLTQVGWAERARQVRQSVVEAPNLDEAARRINVLIAELKTSHTVLLTPDDIDYYILRGVFGRSRPYAGIGMFTVRIEGRDFADLVLEGYPADHAGIRVGDEIVSVDGEPFHPIRSFRGKEGRESVVAIRRAEGKPPVTIDVDVVNIVPLKSFSDATATSARVIERDGRRIGYVHVWASIGDAEHVLAEALARLGATPWPDRRQPRTLPPLDGLIVDMRGKIGGMVGVATRYLEILDPRGPEIAWRGSARSAPASMRGRTAVLIDHHTRSTGEVFVHSYKRERQGPLIGTTTAGAVCGGSSFTMPGDNLLHVAVSGLVIDGDVIEGSGVAPDVTVRRPVPYADGADPVLDAAVALMAKRVQPQQDAKSTSQ
jgi:carboxyl-terminal processing protease